MINFPQRNWTDYGGEVRKLPVLDPFRNPSEEFRMDVLTVGTLLQKSQLSLAV